MEESEPEKGNKTETNFSVWSNREQGSGVPANRWPGVLVTSQLSLHYDEDLSHLRFSSGLISVLCKVYINQGVTRARPEQDTVPGPCHPEAPPPSESSVTFQHSNRKHSREGNSFSSQPNAFIKAFRKCSVLSQSSANTADMIIR